MDKYYKREALALLLLRLGLSWFLFVWAVNKIIEPGQYAQIWGYFHGIEIISLKLRRVCFGFHRL